jgi:hypothetical protein
MAGFRVSQRKPGFWSAIYLSLAHIILLFSDVFYFNICYMILLTASVV